MVLGNILIKHEQRNGGICANASLKFLFLTAVFAGKVTNTRFYTVPKLLLCFVYNKQLIALHCFGYYQILRRVAPFQ